MAWAFGLGSTCFLIGPIPGYASVVGATADAITFFVGSVLFTIGGALQTWLAAPHRAADPAGRAAWWAAVVQSIGTLFFNITTFRALQVTLSNPSYDKLVWRPDAYGSVCFLVSGFIAYRASQRRGWLPVTGRLRVVAAGRQPARMHLLRDRGDRRLRGRVELLAREPGSLESQHVRRRRLLPRVRGRDPAGAATGDSSGARLTAPDRYPC